MIHPDLRRRDAIDRYVGVPLVGAVAVWLLAIIVILYRDARGRLNAGAIAVLVLIGVIALLVLYAGVCAWRRRAWYERLTSLLEREPIAVRVLFSPDGHGSLLARLEPVDQGSQVMQAHFFRPRFDVSSLHATVVSAHLDPEPSGPVVLETSMGRIWPIGARSEAPPSSLDLHQVVTILRRDGYTKEADDLESVTTAAYTTGSEMLGEIGLAILRLERSGAVLPSAAKQIVAATMRDVEKVFPAIRDTMR